MNANLGFKLLMAFALLAYPDYAAQRNNITSSRRVQITSTPRFTGNELRAIKILRTIHSAEVTYQATTGNGKYGSWRQLRNAGLLSNDVAGGQRNGYRFRLRVHSHPGAAPSLVIIATPQLQATSLQRTFAIDESGAVRFSSHWHASIAMMRMLVDEGGGIAANEISAIASLRQIFTSQAVYQSTAGNGDYGRLEELHKEGLLDIVLAAGRKNGYRFKIRVEKTSSESRSFFEAVAVPAIYKKTGVRSFFVDDSGVIRAADNGGAEASANDAPINN